MNHQCRCGLKPTASDKPRPLKGLIIDSRSDMGRRHANCLFSGHVVAGRQTALASVGEAPTFVTAYVMRGLNA